MGGRAACRRGEESSVGGTGCWDPPPPHPLQGLRDNLGG